MKKSLILITSALFMLALAAAPGCSGGKDKGDDDDDDDDGGTLASGTYSVGTPVVVDGCADFYGPDSYYGGVSEVDVTVSGVSLDIVGFPDDLTYDITGNSLQDNVFSGSASFDFSTDVGLNSSYDCVINLTADYHGTITGTNAFTLIDQYDFNGTGTQCAVAASSGFGITVALPCTTTDTVALSL